MRKTSVYLSDQESEQLKQLSLRNGRPQAELIREGVRRVIAESDVARRHYRSLGRGHGGGQPSGAWKAADLYDKAMGER